MRANKDEESKEQPDGWADCCLENIVEKIVGGGTPPKSNPKYFEGNIPWMTVKDMNSSTPKDTQDHITKKAILESSTNLIPPNTPIMATRITLGRVVLVPFETTINQDLKAVFLKSFVDKSFFKYWVLSEANHIDSLGTGTTVKGITLDVLKGLEFPLPPLPEQKRIVERLDRIIPRIDACKERLEKIPLLLKRFRLAILDSAFKGELTAGFLKDDVFDNGTYLLKQIQKIRKEHYTFETNAAKQEGRRAKYGKPGFRTLNSEKVDTFENIPKHWAATYLGNITEIVRGASPRPAGDPRYFKGTIPWITVGEITKDNCVYLNSVSSYVSEAGKERSRFIRKGTLLITNSGATLGVPKVTNIDGCINDGSVAFIYIPIMNKLYLYYYLKSLTDKLRAINQGAAQPNLNTQIISNIVTPIPPLEEQAEIVRRVEALFAFVDRIEASYKKAKAAVDKLTPSTLAKAFRGELVIQDTSDESASALLERFKAERPAVLAIKGKRNAKRK